MFLFSPSRSRFRASRLAAFTLVELLLVVTLITALGGLLLGAGRYTIEQGRILRARAELAAWSAALDAWRGARGDYPASLVVLTPPPAAPVDPWGNAYRYAYKSQQPWGNPRFVLYSAGPDGVADDTLRSGGFGDPAAAGNADNLYANSP